jgi:hypothetical protein
MFPEGHLTIKKCKNIFPHRFSRLFFENWVICGILQPEKEAFSVGSHQRGLSGRIKEGRLFEEAKSLLTVFRTLSLDFLHFFLP